ncbi:MAG: hypothetical protein COA67_02460 [Lutibacter sp.]|nr:MAG: hypothetical protein COA67_02460 [Lutibacter sp.]
MKNLLVIALILFSQQIISAQKNKIYSDSLVTINIPINWKEFNHNSYEDSERIVSFYPKKEKLRTFDKTREKSITFVSLYKTSLKDSMSLSNFLKNRVKLAKEKFSNIEKLQTLIAQNNFGEVQILDVTYINNFSQKNNRMHHLEYNFKHKGYLYSFYYITPEKKYKKYSSNVEYILSSILIKE